MLTYQYSVQLEFLEDGIDQLSLPEYLIPFHL